MSLRRFFARSVAVSALAVIAVAAQGCATATEADDTGSGAGAQQSKAPPQFIALAFDGSFNNAFWQESRDFAKNNNVKFTYFVNPSYYVTKRAASTSGGDGSYCGPTHGCGSSAIGFGDNSKEPSQTLNDIKARLEQTAMAHAEGNEIGSHAVGHWDGSTWSKANWDSEFEQFDRIFFNAAKTAGFPQVNLGFDKDDLVGFRAPQLGHSPGLFQTLSEHNYKYDTSKVAQPNHWPEKSSLGIWNMALASLKVQGRGGSAGKNTLSMDYNFYVADSKGVTDPNPANFKVHEDNMFATYMAYFKGNYYGNRAPLHIGHHFSKWNGGAYWNAMQRFAKEVCNNPDFPEVKCVTYREITAFLEANSSKLEDYQAGRFPRSAAPPSDLEDIGAPIDESMAREGDGAHNEE